MRADRKPRESSVTTAPKAKKASVQKLLSFDVFNRWTGAVQFTAQIDCAPGELPSIKIGLAVKWVVANGANLDGANLDGACLDGANLVGVRLDGASLDDACLVGARLDGASLVAARLVGARLDGASLVAARLDGANLDGARLDGARLVGASLDGASLDDACLDGANLVGVRLDGARLDGADGRYILAPAQSLFPLGRPNGWRALTFVTHAGVQRVFVGCCDFTIAEGRQYWAGKANRREVMAALDYAEAIGKARGWDSIAQSQQQAV